MKGLKHNFKILTRVVCFINRYGYPDMYGTDYVYFLCVYRNGLSSPFSGESGRLNDTLVTESPGKAGKFLWEDIIISVLKKASDQELPVKKLRKKVCTI